MARRLQQVIERREKGLKEKWERLTLATRRWLLRRKVKHPVRSMRRIVLLCCGGGSSTNDDVMWKVKKVKVEMWQDEAAAREDG